MEMTRRVQDSIQRRRRDIGGDDEGGSWYESRMPVDEASSLGHDCAEMPKAWTEELLHFLPLLYFRNTNKPSC